MLNLRKHLLTDNHPLISKTLLKLRPLIETRMARQYMYNQAAYCKPIQPRNIQKRLDWAKEHINDDFRDAIWTDETTVILDSLCYRKKGEKPKLKPRAKHPTKVHVWGGISWNGATKVCIFGIMNAEMYINILEQCLLPSIHSLYPVHSHRFIQDNDPKHTAKIVQAFLRKNQVNWERTPPESPDINPIECLWHELKVYFCNILN